MPSTDPLVMFEEPDGLRQPILIMAFSGWNDAAESATTAARFLGQVWPSRPLASIDPEEFYHFGLSRPYVRFKEDSEGRRSSGRPPGLHLRHPPSTATSSSEWPSSRT
jgi:hypothetical protein